MYSDPSDCVHMRDSAVREFNMLDTDREYFFSTMHIIYFMNRLVRCFPGARNGEGGFRTVLK